MTTPRLSLLLCAAVPLVAHAEPAANMIQNPSFEQRSGPRQPYPEEPWGYGMLDGVARSPFAHWGYSGFWDGGDYDVKLGAGRTENLCARLVCRRRGRAGICTEALRARPGDTLRFRGFFKGIGARGRCWVNFEGDPGDGWATLELPNKADYDWTEVSGQVTVKPPRKGKAAAPDGTVAVYVFVYTMAYGELWIDDLSLTKVSDEVKGR